VRRAEILGVIGRYVECRFKSFTSSFAKWWPKHLHGESADFGGVLRGGKRSVGGSRGGPHLGRCRESCSPDPWSEQFRVGPADVRDFYHDAKDGRYRSWHLKLDSDDLRKTHTCSAKYSFELALEDIVHEIDHHLTYKRPPGTSDQGWIIWKTLSDNEVADLSKTIYNIAVTLDRKRQMASILQSIGTPELRALAIRRARMEILRSTLDTSRTQGAGGKPLNPDSLSVNGD